VLRRDKLLAFDRGAVARMIDTRGARRGQINALSVYEVGEVAFAEPTRITATTRLRDGGLIDVQRVVVSCDSTPLGEAALDAAAALALGLNADLAVFGYTGEYALDAGAAPRTAAQARDQRLQRPILVLYDACPAARRALTLATLLAQMHHTGVVVLLAAREPPRKRRCGRRRRGRCRSATWRCGFAPLSVRDAQAVKEAASVYHAAALLWHGVQAPAERQTLAILVDALKCPLVLVS
jgi:hypothetical protein